MAKTLVSYCGEPLEHIKERFYQEALEVFLKTQDLEKFSNHVDAEVFCQIMSHDQSLSLMFKVWSRGNVWTFTRDYHEF